MDIKHLKKLFDHVIWYFNLQLRLLGFISGIRDMRRQATVERANGNPAKADELEKAAEASQRGIEKWLDVQLDTG
jgi:hypothetical protein